MLAAMTWYDHGMQRLLNLASAFMLGCLLTQATYAADLGEYTDDKPTPPLVLEDRQGELHSLADYRGKVVLVNFWASWCHPCIQEIPELIRLAEILADRPFAILAINVGESKQKLPGFVRKMDEHMVILLDAESEAFEQWGGIGLPSTFILDGTGRIHYEAYGPVNWGADYIVDILTKLMDEPVQETAARQEQQPQQMPVHGARLLLQD